ncbi:conserved hypothetical protein [Coccidioides posadasii str. Silveira]|uniref:Protein kinase domain-containing protein n=1 Tax=Coccidioides posadasii (strain RMSCC 757 / Silveira) TaxID=443226 RepID=E9DCR3_COCPS|nr:conserved hypothetical protein [Coccidioides posadasii str. Silveira]
MGIPTDIWSFGALASFHIPEQWKSWAVATNIVSLQVVSVLYGEGFHIFKPDVPVDHDEYDLKILMEHHRCFGPFPLSYQEIADEGRLEVLMWIMENSPAESLRQFRLTTSREICQEDQGFVLRIMRLDLRDRPTAHQLLEDA